MANPGIKIYGMQELIDYLNSGLVTPAFARKVIDEALLIPAQKVAARAKALAPRNTRNTLQNRTKTEAARLQNAFRARKIRERALRKFDVISRAIAFGIRPSKAAKKSQTARLRALKTKGTTRPARAGSRAYHVHLVILGTKPRWQKTTGRYTGVMPSNDFWTRASAPVLAEAATDLPKYLSVSLDRQLRLDFKKFKKTLGVK